MPSVTLTISTDNYNEFKSGFLKERPIPLDENNQPIMSEGNWIKAVIKTFAIQTYKSGKKKIHDETFTNAGDIVG